MSPNPESGSDEKSAASGERRGWERLAEHGTLAIALAGLAIYGILVLAYSEFFQELGLAPSDVGVEYGKTLGGAAGLATLALALVLGIAGLAWLLAAMIRWRGRDLDPGVWARRVAYLATVLVLLSLLVGLHNLADEYGDRVKSGQRVEPFRLGPSFFDIELLAVRAEPAVVTPLDSALVNLAKNKRLLYIGQTKGVAVVYDPIQQRALYIPTSSALVSGVNCETFRATGFERCKLANEPIAPPQ